LRTCYNCGDKNHFVAECPFENREQNGDKLVRKYKSKTSFKKNFFNKKLVNKNSTNKNPPRYVLVTQEEYSSGDEEEDESPSEVAGVAALATTSTPSTSLFMAKATEVSSPSTSIPNPSKPMLSDLGSLKGKEEVVALDEFISNLQGETKRHFETLMGQLGQAQDFIEEI
jgi:PHD/YefM family antitoxin component YafN of YafNO toxin-antitoxin module